MSAASSTRPAFASPARRVCGPFYATDVPSARRGALHGRLDRRGRHRRAAPGALSGHGCAGRARGSAASSTRSAWASPTRCVGGPFRPRMCSARAGERCMVDSNSCAVRTRVVELVCHACACCGTRAPCVRVLWSSCAMRERVVELVCHACACCVPSSLFRCSRTRRGMRPPFGNDPRQTARAAPARCRETSPYALPSSLRFVTPSEGFVSLPRPL